MKKVSYKKASSYYLIGNLFNKGMGFFTVPIFSRILDTSDYGIVTTYNSWIAILTLVIGFALNMGIRAAFIDYEEKIDDFVSVTTTFTIESGLVLSAIVLGASIFINKSLPMTLLILCLLQGLSAALVSNYSMYLMMRYKFRARTAFMILPNLLSVLLSIFAILFVVDKNHLYMGRIVPTAVVNILFGLIICILVYRKSRVFHNSKYIKYGLMISMPLVLHGIALNILSQSDRTMITWLADASQTGIYSLIYNFSMLATALTTALEGVWVPWFTEHLKNGEKEVINTKVKDYISLITITMVSLVLVGPEVVKLLADKKYWEGITIIPPILLSNFFIFVYTFYVNVEHFHKKTLIITINTVIAAAINIALNYILIPKYGYVAAAYTTLVSYIITAILHSIYAKKLEPTLYPLRYFLLPMLQILIGTVLFYLFQEQWYLRWGIVFIFALISFFIYKNKIMKMFPFVSNLHFRRR